MDVKLTDEQAAYAHHRIEAGKSASVAEVLEAAFQGLIHDEMFDAAVARDGIEAIRDGVREGLAQIERGEGRRWDLDEFLAEARARRAKGADG